MECNCLLDDEECEAVVEDPYSGIITLFHYLNFNLKGIFD